MNTKEQKQILEKLLADEQVKLKSGKRLSDVDRKTILLKIRKLMQQTGYRPEF